MLEGRVVDSIARIDRDVWNALFPGELEDYAYLAAVEAAGLDGFGWRYVLVEEDGRLLAAAPAFVTQYALETTLEGSAKVAARVLAKLAPGLASLRLACLGSPCTETAQIGWAAALTPDRRDAATRALLAAFEGAARADRCGFMAAKDVPEPMVTRWATALTPAGYYALPGLPTAELAIDFDSLDSYLARLSAGVRRDMRRKLKALDAVRIERRRTLAGLEAQVMALYGETRARGDLQFETLTAAYFTGVLERLDDRALCMLYFVGDDLLAINLLLIGDGVLLDKFFCMSAAGRPHNLYFLSWFTNLGLCLEHGLTRYQSGQAAYANKLRLGSRLTATSLWFRHRNRLINQVLRWIAPLASPAIEITP